MDIAILKSVLLGIYICAVYDPSEMAHANNKNKKPAKTVCA